MALQSIANAIGNQAIKGMRMATVKYGPAKAAATEVFLRAADASRQFKRDAALADIDPLSEELQQILDGDESEWVAPRSVRVCYQTIRASRDKLKTTGIDGPVTMLSHWLLEVGGVYYELREHKPNEQGPEKIRNSTILYQEEGMASRDIKLEVSTHRVLHPSTKYEELSTTVLSDEKIIWAASLVFGRFGTSYDLFIDNCQLFTQMLAEAISIKEDRGAIVSFFDERSVMKLPVAASWFAAPVYGCTKALHYALEPDTPGQDDELYQGVSNFLNNMENFYLHPRVLAARRKQNPFN